MIFLFVAQLFLMLVAASLIVWNRLAVRRNQRNIIERAAGAGQQGRRFEIRGIVTIASSVSEPELRSLLTRAVKPCFGAPRAWVRPLSEHQRFYGRCKGNRLEIFGCRTTRAVSVFGVGVHLSANASGTDIRVDVGAWRAPVVIGVAFALCVLVCIAVWYLLPIAIMRYAFFLWSVFAMFIASRIAFQDRRVRRAVVGELLEMVGQIAPPAR